MKGRNRKRTYNACDEQGVDTDDDLIPDCYEIQYGLSETNPDDAQLNNDTDSLNNFEEFLAHTNPNASDTDGDGVNDDIEVMLGFNPLYHDTDLDGDPDLQEYQAIQALRDGDANGDGQLNAADMLLLQRHIYGLSLLPDAQKLRVDVYPPFAPDGILNIQDWIILGRRLIQAP